MDSSFHRFDELFAQLGLPGDSASITRFIATHGPLPGGTRLEDAPFWSPAQARLLREELAEDADWSAVIDRLSLALRRPD
jgi:hypothetical protein